jgi:hypothetical protein
MCWWWYGCTVITGQSVYQLYLEKGLFHSGLCGFFPIKFFPEAEGKIPTKLSLMEILPHMCKYLSIYIYIAGRVHIKIL